MDKLKEIRSLDDLKEFIKLNKDVLKKAALPIVVAAALVFFWISGGDDGDVRQNGQADTETVLTEENSMDTTEETGKDEDEIYVDICGCVNSPGVYKVKAGTRLFQVIEKAGGITDDADVETINRAEEVQDGQKIIIYAEGSESDKQISGGGEQDGKININRADSDQLQEIPGVGPATAQKIIEYRQSSGNFSSIEELMEISGIGEKTFAEMKDHITV